MIAWWKSFKMTKYHFCRTLLPCFVLETFRFVWYANVKLHYIMSFHRTPILVLCAVGDERRVKSLGTRLVCCLIKLYWNKCIWLAVIVTRIERVKDFTRIVWTLYMLGPSRAALFWKLIMQCDVTSMVFCMEVNLRNEPINIVSRL